MMEAIMFTAFMASEAVEAVEDATFVRVIENSLIVTRTKFSKS